jgi:hypothetical protein
MARTARNSQAEVQALIECAEGHERMARLARTCAAELQAIIFTKQKDMAFQKEQCADCDRMPAGRECGICAAFRRVWNKREAVAASRPARRVVRTKAKPAKAEPKADGRGFLPPGDRE